MKWLNRYHIWRYRRYERQGLFNIQRKGYVDTLASRLSFLKTIRLHPSEYRQRRSYLLRSHTHCLGELLDATEEVVERATYQSYGIDRMSFQQRAHSMIDYDSYLVNQEGFPYYEREPAFSEELTNALEPLIEQLRLLRSSDQVLYAYYVRVLRPLFEDWDEFIDTCIRLQLGVDKP